jgi:hypothetical protein
MPVNPLLFASKPLQGLISTQTASFYMLDPTGTVPVEVIADIVPGITPFRQTLDVIDNETFTSNYRVTRNSLQDFSDVTPNVHAELKQLVVQGTLTANGPLSLIGVPPPPTFGLRFDLLRLTFLQNLAEQRRPIACITPRVSLPQCFIASLQHNYNPSLGASISVSVTLIEARIASPFTTQAIPDTQSLAPGNYGVTGGGEQSVTPATNVSAQPNVVPQAAPILNPFG